MHDVPAVQTLPHAPQLRGLVATFTQPLPHCVSPGAHEAVQIPPEQTRGAGQAFPQAPQFEPSEVTSMQAPPHEVSPSWHWQTPAWQA